MVNNGNHNNNTQIEHVQRQVDSLQATFELFLKTSMARDQELKQLQLERLQLEEKREQEREQREKEREQREKEREQREKEREQREKEREQREQAREKEREQHEQAREKEREQREQAREKERKQREQAREKQREQERLQHQQVQLEKLQQDSVERAKERKAETKAWNKKWGEIANRIGRMVEDIVSPNIPRIAQEYFYLPRDAMDFSIRRKVTKPNEPGKQREFDVLAVYPEAVLINETKEAIRQRYLEAFANFIQSGEFYEYFPQYKGRTLIPIFSALNLPESAIDYLTKHNIYAMGLGDETMDLLNFERLHPGVKKQFIEDDDYYA